MSVVIAYSTDRGTTWTYYNEQVQIAINEIFTVASRGVDIAGRYGSWFLVHMVVASAHAAAYLKS